MTERPRWSRDELGVLLAGVVFFGLAFAPWYEASSAAGTRYGVRAWDLGAIGVIAVLASAYASLRVLWVKAKPLGPDVPVSPAAEPFVASLAALLLTLYRAVDVPGLPQAARTAWLSSAAFVVLFQAIFATRHVRTAGFRAPPP